MALPIAFFRESGVGPGVVCLRRILAALANPGRVQALALYEPTLFALIDAQSSSPNAADGIRQAVHASSIALDEQNPNDAAKHFIDYWMGSSSWDNTPESRKLPIAASIVNVRRWGHALLTEPTPLAAFRTLSMPVLYMVGKKFPAIGAGSGTTLDGCFAARRGGGVRRCWTHGPHHPFTTSQ